MQEISKLIVKYNGKIVGYLAQIEKDIVFQYDENWVKNGFSISPFSLPLTNKIYKNNNNIFEGLFGVVNDSLPDGWGELLVRRMLAKKGINFDKLTPLQRLSIIEKNGLGALEFEPNQNFKASFNNLDLDALSLKTNEVLNNNSNDCDLDDLYFLGGSSGGSRPKAHIKIDDEEWIVKFPSKIDPKDIGQKEFKANSLAKKCGINVNEFKLFDSKNCSGYFGAKRFDRTKSGKVHVISLAGLLETSFWYYNLDYGHLFKVIKAISIKKEDDMYEAYKRMCFNVFYHNTDDHSKNFSFLYDENLGGYVLSPFYDITFTPYQEEHSMTINHKGNPTEEDLLQVAKDFNLSLDKCKKIIEKIKEVLRI